MAYRGCNRENRTTVTMSACAHRLSDLSRRSVCVGGWPRQFARSTDDHFDARYFLGFSENFKMKSCCAVADPRRDLRMRAAFTDGPPADDTSVPAVLNSEPGHT